MWAGKIGAKIDGSNEVPFMIAGILATDEPTFYHGAWRLLRDLEDSLWWYSLSGLVVQATPTVA